MNEFFDMGGHGVYIWPCYAMAFVLLAGVLLFSLKDLSKNKKELAIMEQLTDKGAKS